LDKEVPLLKEKNALIKKKIVFLHEFIAYLMKKILVTLAFLVAISFTSQAQLLNFGFRGGVGMGVHVDDLATNRPILAANVGGFVSFGFTNSQSFFAQNLMVQTGLNLIRRGSKFEEVLESVMSIREGSHSVYYLQLPVLATFRYELPIREPGHFGLLSVGPAVSYGLFGWTNDRKISQGYPQNDWNYRIENDPVFNHLNRLDVSFILGVGYEWQDLSVMLQVDYGFLAVKDEVDVLKTDSESQSYHTSDVLMVPQGNNFALLLTVGYQFPVR